MLRFDISEYILLESNLFAAQNVFIFYVYNLRISKAFFSELTFFFLLYKCELFIFSVSRI